MRNARTVRRVAAAILVASQLAGCARWQTHHLSPRRLITEQHPHVVLVAWAGRRSYLLDRPSIVQDSLVGTERSTLRRIAIPLSEVAQIQTRQADSGKTAALGLGIVTGVGLALLLLVRALIAAND